jgi:hypothetical protein
MQTQHQTQNNTSSATLHRGARRSLWDAPVTAGSDAGRCRQYEAFSAFCPPVLAARLIALAVNLRWSSLRPFSSVFTKPGWDAKTSTLEPYGRHGCQHAVRTPAYGLARLLC